MKKLEHEKLLDKRTSKPLSKPSNGDQGASDIGSEHASNIYKVNLTDDVSYVSASEFTETVFDRNELEANLVDSIHGEEKEEDSRAIEVNRPNL